MADSPMEQFRVHRIWEDTIPALQIGSVDVSFTNASLWMCIVSLSAALLLLLASSRTAIVPGRLQSIAELSYSFVANMIYSTAGNKGMQFFPFIFTLFIFVLFANFLGLIPPIFFHPFTITSHIIVTFALAFFIFLMVIVVGLWKHGLHFFSLFTPKVPWVMLILLVPIEIVSFLSRPISLSVRLFANMLAGHTMLAVFGTFVIGLASAGGFLSVLSIAPLLAITAVSALEFLIAFLQAYVFTILTCIYLNDALNLHDH